MRPLPPGWPARAVVAVSRSGRVPETEGSVRPLVADLSDSEAVDAVIDAAVSMTWVGELGVAVAQEGVASLDQMVAVGVAGAQDATERIRPSPASR